MITLTEEQAQQIEEALLDWKENFPNHWDLSDKQALATIRTARAQEQAEQEPVAFLTVGEFGGVSVSITSNAPVDVGRYPLYAALSVQKT